MTLVLSVAARVASAVVVLAVLLLIARHALAAGNVERWRDASPVISRWFQSLTQPDNPAASCCGEADAYEADVFESETGDVFVGYDSIGQPKTEHGEHYVAVITDGKGVIKNGTRVPVPNQKMKWDAGNPTGHGIIFIGVDGHVLCYVTPGGV